MLRGHGDDVYNFKQTIVSNFSSNVYSRQDLSALHQHLSSCMELIHSYPEPDAHSLAELLARKHSIGDDNLCVTNGATEAIYLIAQAFGNSRTTIIIPTFSEYEDACTIHNHQLSFCCKLNEVEPQTEMVWICNPNNPDGNVYDIDYLERFVKHNEKTVFVFDQSYGYFTDKKVWEIKHAAKYKNVILLHSMTKQYAIPGLRLGYITAHNEILQRIAKFRMPWSVNGLAIEAGKFLTGNTLNLLNTADFLKESRRLQEALSLIKGITVFPSHTHYFLCRLDNKKASELKTWLVKNYGILIRDAANFRGLDERYFRVAGQLHNENDLLIKAIQEWI